MVYVEYAKDRLLHLFVVLYGITVIDHSNAAPILSVQSSILCDAYDKFHVITADSFHSFPVTSFQGDRNFPKYQWLESVLADPSI